MWVKAHERKYVMSVFTMKKLSRTEANKRLFSFSTPSPYKSKYAAKKERSIPREVLYQQEMKRRREERENQYVEYLAKKEAEVFAEANHLGVTPSRVLEMRAEKKEMEKKVERAKREEKAFVDSKSEFLGEVLSSAVSIITETLTPLFA